MGYLQHCSCTNVACKHVASFKQTHFVLVSLQVYVSNFRQLLDKLSEEEDSQARQRLNNLTLEFQTMILVIPLLYPGKMKEFGNCRMDTGESCSEPSPFDQKPGLNDPKILVRITLWQHCMTSLFCPFATPDP